MVETISTTALHNHAKRPTMKEIEKDFLKN